MEVNGGHCTRSAAAEMEFMRWMAKYIWMDNAINEDILKEKNESTLGQI
jgi:hypothetical protein